MRVGYLHLALPNHGQLGLTRCGRLIAAEARRRPELDVLEVDAMFAGGPRANADRLREAARRLAQADVVHVQFSRYLWQAGWEQRYYWHVFRSHCPRPLVTTLHDIYPYFYPPEGWRAALRRDPAAPKGSQGLSLRRARNSLGALKNLVFDGQSLRAIANDCSAVLVCTAEEQRRAAHLAPPGRIRVIPHFVEPRRPAMSRAAARHGLGVEDGQIITLQGFLYPNKGHRLLAQALPQLPPQVRVIFAGGPVVGGEGFQSEVLALAEASGAASRLRVTGYLPEAELERYLVASDLAICPFSIVSASSSVATWISVARPILASDLPQMAEYAQWAPGAVRLFRPYEPGALAEAICALLPECGDGDDPAVARLREALSMRLVFDRHLEEYSRAAGGT